MVVIGAIGISARALAQLIYPIKSNSAPTVGDIAAEMHSMHIILQRFPSCSIPTTSWSMRFMNMHAILESLDRLQPRTVVEFGSGISTLLIASWLRESGGGQLISFDHDKEWAKRTQQHLDRANLSDFVSLHCVPLVETEIDGRTVFWYATEPAHFDAAPVDFAVVDGPPAHLSIAGMSRLPALATLNPYLSDKFFVALDDAHRAGEKEILRCWTVKSPDCRVICHATHTGLGCVERNGPRLATSSPCERPKEATNGATMQRKT